MKVILQGLKSKLMITQGYGVSGEEPPGEQPTVCLTPGRGVEILVGERVKCS
jgi:hypothetical protein